MKNIKSFFKKREKQTSNQIPFPDLSSPFVECKSCFKNILQEPFWFTCTECTTGYSVCLSCFPSSSHPHLFSKSFVESELAHEIISNQPNVCQSLLASFAIHSDFPLFGVCRSLSSISSKGKEEEEERTKEIIRLTSSKNEEFEFEWIKYSSVYLRSFHISKAIQRLTQLKKGDIVGICGNNSLEYFLFDFAVSFLKLTIIPIPSNFEDANLRVIIEETKLKWIISESLFTNKWIDFQKEFNLELIGVIEYEPLNRLKSPPSLSSSLQEEHKEEGVQILKGQLVESFGKTICEKEEMNLEALIPTLIQKEKEFQNKTEEEKAKERKKREEEGKETYTIIFTSGSTGTPKGAIYSNFIWKKAISSPEKSRFFPRIGATFSPLYHLSGKRRVMADFLLGSRIGILSLGMEFIYQELELLSPTHLGSTPRLFNVLFEQYQTELENHCIQHQLEKTGDEFLSFQKQLLSFYSSKLGNRIRAIAIGGAPVSSEVLSFLKQCFRCSVTNNYGSTETGSIFSSSGGMDLSKLQFKLEDVPELNYFSTDKPFPRGEFLVKTKTMIQGYFNNPKLNQESFNEEGYFRTGDIVQLIAPNVIQIIDRKKSFLKLAQGEFIAPEKLEVLYSKSKFVRQIFITGDSLQSFIVGMIVPNFTLLKSSLDPFNSQSLEEKDMISSSRAKEAIFKDLVRIAQEEHLATYEIPLRFSLIGEEFTLENGLLTSSFKLARNKARIHFKDTIEELYSTGKDEKLKKGDYNSKLFASIVASVLGCKSIEEGDSLQSLGLDSLAAVSIRSKLKAKTGVEIPMNVIYNSSDLSQINQFLQNTESNSPSFHDGSNPQSWKQEIDSILFNSQILPKIKENSKLEIGNSGLGIFLTGATGFLGAFLLQELLQSENSDIYCLIRISKETIEEDKKKVGMEKLKRNFENYRLIWNQSYDNRIEIVEGDLKLVQFGLSLQQFEKLGTSIGRIVHCGSWVNTIFDYQTLKPSNVLGTLEAIKLASISNHRVAFHFVSSISAAFGLKEGKSQLLEEEEYKLATKQKGYALSKWVAERLVIEAQKEGLIAIIYQPGTISGSQMNGSSNKLDYVSLIIEAMLAMKSVPQSPTLVEERNKEYSINLTPVDVIARWISQFVFNSQLNPSLFPSNSSSPIRIPMIHPMGNLEWKDLIHAIQSFSNVQTIPYANWYSSLTSSLSSSKKTSLLEPFLPSLQRGLPSFKISGVDSIKIMKESSSAFNHLEMKAKKIDKKLLVKYLEDLSTNLKQTTS